MIGLKRFVARFIGCNFALMLHNYRKINILHCRGA